MISVSARTGPGWTLVSQTIFGHLVCCWSPGSGSWINLMNLGVADPLRLLDCVQKYFSNATGGKINQRLPNDA